MQTDDTCNLERGTDTLARLDWSTRSKLDFWLDGIESQTSNDTVSSAATTSETVSMYSHWARRDTGSNQGSLHGLLEEPDHGDGFSLPDFSADLALPLYEEGFAMEPRDAGPPALASSIKVCGACEKMGAEVARLERMLGEQTRAHLEYRAKAEAQIANLKHEKITLASFLASATRDSVAAANRESPPMPPAVPRPLASDSNTPRSELTARKHRIPNISIGVVPFDSRHGAGGSRGYEEAVTEDGVHLDLFVSTPAPSNTSSPALPARSKLSRNQSTGSVPSPADSQQSSPLLVPRKPRSIGGTTCGSMTFCAFSQSECPLGEACASLHVTPIGVAARKTPLVRGRRAF